MHLENIRLKQFKNYHQADVNFSKYINCILGANGSGKTNLLDAIHYLSLTKSALNPIDQQNIKHGEKFFSIRGVFNLSGKLYGIQCNCQSGLKKVIKKDSKAYTRMSDHIGLFPLVLMSPYDTDILRDGSLTRRKFMDNIISQVDGKYLTDLIKYQRLLNQRNQLLKTFAFKQRFDLQLLETYDESMIGLMQEIFKRRNRFIEEFNPVFKSHYQLLSEGSEQVDLSYKSDLFSEEFPKKFAENHQRDLGLQRTEFGIHKDDLNCLIGRHPIRKFGSQGQQKSFVIALKLGQFDLLHEAKGFKPILLLDDVFDKLDDKRIEKLIDMVSGETFGQLFITDARPERTTRLLKKLPSEIASFTVDRGIIQ